jgi:hypothetical protein
MFSKLAITAFAGAILALVIVPLLTYAGGVWITFLFPAAQEPFSTAFFLAAVGIIVACACVDLKKK